VRPFAVMLDLDGRSVGIAQIDEYRHSGQRCTMELSSHFVRFVLHKATCFFYKLLPAGFFFFFFLALT